MGGAAARTGCTLPGTPEIAFNESRHDDYTIGTLRLRGLAAHEWGHAWGIGHSPVYDSHGGGPPTMSTCWNDFDEQAVVSQDDSAAVQAYQNTSGTYGASTANPSFEEGWNWWGFGNSGYGHRGIYYGGQDNTRRKGRFSAANTSSQSYIYSTTRLSHKTDGHLVMRNTKIKARANYKKAISASSGSVVVSLRVRAVDYVDGVWDAQCQMVLSANLNQSTIGSWVTKSVLAYPTTSWNYRTTGVYTVGYTIAGTTAEAVDARVYVYNRLKFDGGFTSMDVDRVRVLVDRP